jgi:hypothetical protein
MSAVGGKRTSEIDDAMSANDPNATSVSPSCSVTKLVSNPIKALV